MAESAPRGASPSQQAFGSSTTTLALTVGFLALSYGVARAHWTPATGYEVSIYAATPAVFWACVAVAETVSLAVVLSSSRGRAVGLALSLGASGVLAVASLPVIRGYHFNGHGDALTHLGWAREIAASSMNPLELVYPSSHLLGTSVAALLGIEPRQALLLVVPVFVLAYVVFTTLTVRVLADGPGATAIGAFVAFLLLPIFNVGGSLMFIPFTLAALSAPLFLYLLVVYLDRSSHSFPVSDRVSDLDAVVLLAGTSLLLTHPQLFSDVLILLGTVSAVQAFYRWSGRESSIARQRWAGYQFVALSALFVAWNAAHPAAAQTIDTLVTALTGGGTPGAVVQQRGASLTAIGASLPELFVKLLLVNVIVAAFAGYFVVTRFLDGSDTDLDAWARYLPVAGVLLFGYAAVHFVGPSSSYFFRHAVFGMVLVSVFGAVGIHCWTRNAAWLRRGPLVERGATAATAVVALAALALSVAVFFPSPYIYSQSHHVTESVANGYESAFENRAEGVQFTGVRGGAGRYSEAMTGVPEIRSDPLFGESIRSGLRSEVDSDSYFVVTEIDRQREVRAYRELRVTSTDFERIAASTDVSRVQSNGGFEMYYVPADESTERASAGDGATPARGAPITVRF